MSTGAARRVATIAAVLWIARADSPWRDLPEVFGDLDSVFRRFSRWSHKSIWWRIFAAMSDAPVCEYLIVDSIISSTHQHASGAKKGAEDQVLGRSRGRPEHQNPHGRAWPRLPGALRFEKTAKHYLTVVTIAATIYRPDNCPYHLALAVGYRFQMQKVANEQ